MPIICRVVAVLKKDLAVVSSGDTAKLGAFLKDPDTYTELYRYWHAIHFLLSQQDSSPSARAILEGGTAVIPAKGDIPSSRLISVAEVASLNETIAQIEPDQLVQHFDPAAMDAAKVYPNAWVALTQEHDLLGDVLEHYDYLRQAAAARVESGEALLLQFFFSKDETDD